MLNEASRIWGSEMSASSAWSCGLSTNENALRSRTAAHSPIRFEPATSSTASEMVPPR
jgi:hypothetical protein